MDISSIELLDRIRKYAQGAVKPSRYEHCERVGETAMILCELFDEHPWKGYLAGVSHDMCRELDDQAMLSLVSHDNLPVSDLERESPILLHGRAAAVKLFRDFGVSDADILQAVARHTFGGEGMRPLAKILFIADKIEPGRPWSTQSYREPLYAMSLDQMCLSVIDDSMRYLESKGKSVSPVTRAFRESVARSLGAEAAR